MPSLKDVAESLARDVREHVAAALVPLMKKLGDLELRVEMTAVRAIAPPKGDPGLPGESIKGDPGEPGKPGRDGADVDMDAVSELIAIEVKEQVGQSPKAKDGADGEKGKDGASVHPDTIARMVLEEVQRVVAAMPRPKDGEHGRDALAVEVLPGIEESKSYPRGTYAEYRGGEIRAIRNTDPITEGLDKAGWVVCRNGVADESEETLDEGRTLKRTTTYTNGRTFVREIKTSCILYREVWREGEYEHGDVVTWGGSAWHCKRKTTEKPAYGCADWQMMVKEGRHGKDASPALHAHPQATTVVRTR